MVVKALHIQKVRPIAVQKRYRVDYVNPSAQLLQEQSGHEVILAFSNYEARNHFNSLYPKLLATTVTELDKEVPNG